MAVTHDKCGVVIVGVNKGADIKALRTAESVKKHMPDMHITFFTDQRFKVNTSLIDKIVYISSRSDEPCLKYANKIPDQGIAAKMTYIHKCNYEYTLYLDYDIYVTDSLWELFDTMDEGNYELAVAPYQFREKRTDIPNCFPYFNTGLVAWKKSDNTDLFFDIWWNEYLRISCNGSACFDEIAFQNVLYKYKALRYMVLPIEYNCRPVFPSIVGSKIKIIHGIPTGYRIKGISSLDDKLNGIEEDTIRVIYSDKILYTYSKDGIFEAK